MCAVWVGVYNAVQLGGAWFIMLFNWEGVVAPVFYLEEEALSLSLTPFHESGKKLRFQLRAGKSLLSLQVSHNMYQIQSVIKGHFFPHLELCNC